MGSNPTLSAVYDRCLGEVLEWPNRRDWKSRVPSQGEPWVRIPPSPPCLILRLWIILFLVKRGFAFKAKVICHRCFRVLASDLQNLTLIGRKIRYG